MTSTLTPEKGKDYRTLMRNLRMAETVCLALEQVPCAHFIYLSSDAVYDAHEIPVDERSSRQPADVYALSHAAREMMFELALKATAIPLCILRLTSIYGPGDTHNSYGPNRFVRSALKDGGIGLFGNGEELRSHVFVEDAVALTGLALKHVSFGTVNVANQPAVSFLDIAQIVAGLAGRPVRIGNLPRATPVVHRTFENAALRAAFPEFHFKNLEKGLTMFMESERASANVTGNALSKGKK